MQFLASKVHYCEYPVVPDFAMVQLFDDAGLVKYTRSVWRTNVPLMHKTSLINAL